MSGRLIFAFMPHCQRGVEICVLFLNSLFFSLLAVRIIKLEHLDANIF